MKNKIYHPTTFNTVINGPVQLIRMGNIRLKCICMSTLYKPFIEWKHVQCEINLQDRIKYLIMKFGPIQTYIQHTNYIM